MPSCVKGENLGAADGAGEVKNAVPLGTWEEPFQ